MEVERSDYIWNVTKAFNWASVKQNSRETLFDTHEIHIKNTVSINIMLKMAKFRDEYIVNMNFETESDRWPAFLFFFFLSLLVVVGILFFEHTDCFTKFDFSK